MVIAAAHPFLSSLEHIVGFLFVMAALGTLWGITLLVGAVFGRAKPAAALAAADPVADSSAIEEEEVAAIAATVAVLMGRRSRVVSIQSSAAKDWNREGRREHFASHRIR
jgi:hypothetical protein